MSQNGMNKVGMIIGIVVAVGGLVVVGLFVFVAIALSGMGGNK